jgi:hypothetical protein
VQVPLSVFGAREDRFQKLVQAALTSIATEYVRGWY